MDFDVVAGGAEEGGGGGAVAQDFFNGSGEEVEVGEQAGALIGVFNEAENGVVDQVGGGFVAGGEEELDEAEDLVFGEVGAFDFGEGEAGEEVVFGGGESACSGGKSTGRPVPVS